MPIKIAQVRRQFSETEKYSLEVSPQRKGEG